MEGFEKIIVILIVAVVTTLLGAVALCTYHTRAMARIGYEEVCVPGRSETIWQKTK